MFKFPSQPNPLAKTALKDNKLKEKTVMQAGGLDGGPLGLTVAQAKLHRPSPLSMHLTYPLRQSEVWLWSLVLVNFPYYRQAVSASYGRSYFKCQLNPGWGSEVWGGVFVIVSQKQLPFCPGNEDQSLKFMVCTS